ncbi:MAG: hypothetical protein H6739_41820 [Alphaproteobacteria bacterium]|nr:hypothetical protein [Alphaproteobacteria bacterium]
MDPWTTLKVAFSNADSTRRRFARLRPEAADPLAEVRTILDLPGPVTLPAEALKLLGSAWASLQQQLDIADAQLSTQPGSAFKSLFRIVEPARTLLTLTRQEHDKVLQEDAERRAALDACMESLEEAKRHIQFVLDRGCEAPDLVARNVADVEEVFPQFNAVQLVEVKQALDGFVSDFLRPLRESVTRAAALKRSEPRNVPEDIARKSRRLLGAVKAAVKDSEVDEARAAVEAYAQFVADLLLRVERGQVVELPARPDPREALDGLKLQLRDVVDYPPEYASPAVLAHQKAVQVAWNEVLVCIDLQDKAERDLQHSTSGDEMAQHFAGLMLVEAMQDVQKALSALKQALSQARDVLAAHDAAMRRYYAALKKLMPRVTFAEALPLQEDGVDTPWKVQRVAFDKALAAVKAAVDPPKRDYGTGNQRLIDLKKAIDALSTARSTVYLADLDEATDVTHGSARQAQVLVERLAKTPGLIAEMKPDQQLRLLRTMRTQLCFCRSCAQGFDPQEFKDNGGRCPNLLVDGVTDCNSTDVELPTICANRDCLREGRPTPGNPCPACSGEDWQVVGSLRPTLRGGKPNPIRDLLVTRAKVLAEMKLTPEFEAFDQKKRRETKTALQKDQLFAKARGSWTTWVKNNDFEKIEAFYNRAIQLQCRILGHDQKDLSCQRGDTVHTFPDAPVKARLHTPDPPEPEKDGYCEFGFPTFIVINTTSNQFGSFKEQVETILHENAHAFQAMLARKIMAKAPFDEEDREELLAHPELGLQASLFLENSLGYITTNSIQDDDVDFKLFARAYRHEPMEEHAWATGTAVSRSLLAPPLVESFMSSDTLRSRIWFVKEVSREHGCTVTLHERHGICPDEWEGDQPGDKLLTLERIRKDHDPFSATVRILEIVDEYRLQLDLDTRDYDPLVMLEFDPDDPKHPVLNKGTDPTKIAGESIRLVLHEWVQDL